MANGQIVTTVGKKIVLNRTFKTTPDYLEPSLFKVGTGTTTPLIGDTDLVTPVTISGGSQTKTFAASYPSLDETNLNATIRCILLTNEANGNSLTEWGVFNNDGTKKCFSRQVFTAISKTSSVQVIFIEKDLIE